MSKIQESEQNYTKNYNNFSKSVIIIGAGPSGILSTKYISEKNNVLCVEGKSDIGGLWKFDDVNENNHPSLHTDAYYNSYGVLQSSLYENLVCNGNKCVMCFKGVAPKREYNEYMKSEQFYSYLTDYTEKNQLKKFMTFETFVQSVRLTKNMTQQELQEVNIEVTKKFVVQLVDSSDYNKNTRYVQADHIVVCTGHYSVPNYPVIESQNLFSGDLIHMHYFRKAKISQYANRHLVIYGAGLSAQDVCYILLKKSGDLKPSKITVIGNKSLIDCQVQAESYINEIASGQIVFKSGLIQKYTSNNSIVLDSGEVVEDIDNMLYATGYQYSYPFLEKNSSIDNIIEFYNERKSAFGPLYKRMFSVREQDVIFLGTVQTAFQLQSCLERQAIIAQRYIDGLITLPSKEDMLESFNEDFSETCKVSPCGKNYLKVSLAQEGFNDFKYTAQLQELAQVPFDAEFEKLYKEIIYPIYYKIAMNGNYAILKSLDYTQLVDPDYAPKPGFF